MKSEHEQEIKGLCRYISGKLKWRMTPFDSKEIDQLADKLFRCVYGQEVIAKEFGYDVNILIDILSYLSQRIDGPTGENDQDAETWFTTKFGALAELVFEHGKVNGRGADFFAKVKYER